MANRRGFSSLFSGEPTYVVRCQSVVQMLVVVVAVAVVGAVAVAGAVVGAGAGLGNARRSQHGLNKRIGAHVVVGWVCVVMVGEGQKAMKF